MTRPIPKVPCGSCTDCCTIVPFNDAEKEAASKLRPDLVWVPAAFASQHAEGWVMQQALETMRCPFATYTRGCTIYSARPMICRTYGAGEGGMRCARGKGPKRERDRLSHAEVVERLEKAKDGEHIKLDGLI